MDDFLSSATTRGIISWNTTDKTDASMVIIVMLPSSPIHNIIVSVIILYRVNDSQSHKRKGVNAWGSINSCS